MEARVRRRLWIVALVLAPVVVLAPFGWLVASTADRRSAADTAEQRPVALVLGAGVRPDGRPSLLLARRLDVAADLYRRGLVDAVLVSGDNSVETYNETDTMRAYLVAAGVPDRKIAGDYAGFSTWDSCARAHDVFGVRAATVVTQDFHLPRAVALCRAGGIDTAGVGDASTDVPQAVTYGYAREIAAAFQALTTMVFRPDPHFLGPYEPGVENALASPR